MSESLKRRAALIASFLTGGMFATSSAASCGIVEDPIPPACAQECTDGAQGQDGIPGEDGAPGKDGAQGVEGPPGASPFELDGDDAYYTQGYIGVGTDAPAAQLQVDSSTDANPPVGGLGCTWNSSTCACNPGFSFYDESSDGEIDADECYVSAVVTNRGDVDIREGRLRIGRYSSPGITFRRNDPSIGNGDVLAQMHFTGSDTAERFGGLIVARAVGEWGPNTNQAGTKLEFWTQDSTDDGNLGVRLAIQDDGAVGIGTGDTTATCAADAALCVNGNVYATTVQLTSDRRFKKNISTIDSSLAKVSALRGVEFEWRRNEFPSRALPEGTEMGFIGQEVEEVVPSIVSTNGSGVRSVKYAQMNALLVEAVKELSTKNDALEARLSALEKSLAQR